MADIIQTKEVLKQYFETGDRPTEIQYRNLIHSLRHINDKIGLHELNLEGYDEEGERDNSLIVRLGDFLDASNGTKIVLTDDAREVKVSGNLIMDGDVNASGQTVTAGTFIGDGSQLTNLPSQVPANVAYKDSDNNFSFAQTINSGNTNQALSLNSSDSTVIMAMSDNTTSMLTAIGAVGNDMRLYTGDTWRYQIDASGNHDFNSGAATFGGNITVNNSNISLLKTTTPIVSLESASNRVAISDSNIGTTTVSPFSIQVNGTNGYTMDILRNHDFKSGTATFGGQITANGGIQSSGNIDASGQTVIANIFNGNLLSAPAIIGNSTGNSNSSYLRFTENDGTTRQGWIGFGSSGNQHLQIYHDATSKALQLRDDGTLFWGTDRIAMISDVQASDSLQEVTLNGNSTDQGIVINSGGLEVTGSTIFSGDIKAEDTIKLGSSVGNNTVNSGTLDFLENINNNFGETNGYGFRFTYNGDGNIFNFRSGNDTNTQTIYSVGRDDGEFTLYRDVALNDGFQNITSHWYKRSIYHATNGILIETDVDASQDKMIELIIEGNSYFNDDTTGPIISRVQAYNYNATGTIVQTGGLSNDPDFTIDVFHYNGKVHFWFEQTGQFQTFSFRTNAGVGSSPAKIVNVTNAVKPSSGVTQNVSITPIQMLTSTNISFEDIPDRPIWNWGTNRADIVNLTTGSTFGTILEGAQTGHITVGIRGNDPGDSFWILETNDDINDVNTYTKTIMRVNDTYFQYKGNDVVHTGNMISALQNSFLTISTNQTITGQKTFSENIDTPSVNGFLINDGSNLSSADGSAISFGLNGGMGINTSTNSTGSINYPNTYGGSWTFSNNVGDNGSTWNRTFTLFTGGDNNVYLQTYAGGNPTGWSKILTENNFTGIVDDNFVTLDSTQTIAGYKTFTDTVRLKTGTGIKGSSTGVINSAFFSFYESNNTTRQGWIGFGSNLNSDISIVSDVSGGHLKLDEDGNLYYNNQEVLDTGNHVAGTDYVSISGNETISGEKIFTNNVTATNFIGNGSQITNVDATKLDGLDSNRYIYGNSIYGTENTFPTDGGSGANSIRRSSFYRDNNHEFGSLGIHVNHPTNINYAFQLATTSYGGLGNIRYRLLSDNVWTSEALIRDTVNFVAGTDYVSIDGNETISGEKTFTQNVNMQIVKPVYTYLNGYDSGSPVIGVKGKGSGQSFFIAEQNDSTVRMMDIVETANGAYQRWYNNGVETIRINGELGDIEVSGTTRLEGKTIIHTGNSESGALVLQRHTYSNTGDDIARLWLDDFSLNFLLDNDDDGDNGAFSFYKKVSGANNLMFRVGTSSIDANLPVNASGQTITAGNFVGDGSQLTNLPIQAPTNVAYKDSDNNFSEAQTFENYLHLRGAASGGSIGFNRNTDNGDILNPLYGAFQLQTTSDGRLQIQRYNSGGTSLGDALNINLSDATTKFGGNIDATAHTITGSTFEFPLAGGTITTNLKRNGASGGMIMDTNSAVVSSSDLLAVRSGASDKFLVKGDGDGWFAGDVTAANFTGNWNGVDISDTFRNDSIKAYKTGAGESVDYDTFFMSSGGVHFSYHSTLNHVNAPHSSYWIVQDIMGQNSAHAQFAFDIDAFSHNNNSFYYRKYNNTDSWSNWVKVLNNENFQAGTDYVSINGNETITGLKTFSQAVSAPSFRPTNIVTNRIVKFNGLEFDDSSITDDGTTVTVSANINASNQTVTTASLIAKDGAENSKLTYYGVEFNRATSYLRPTSNQDKDLWIGGLTSGVQDWNNINFRGKKTNFYSLTAFQDGVEVGGTTNKGVLQFFDYSSAAQAKISYDDGATQLTYENLEGGEHNFTTTVIAPNFSGNWNGKSTADFVATNSANVFTEDNTFNKSVIIGGLVDNSVFPAPPNLTPAFEIAYDSVNEEVEISAAHGVIAFKDEVKTQMTITQLDNADAKAFVTKEWVEDQETGYTGTYTQDGFQYTYANGRLTSRVFVG